ncbi:MAG: GNAT family N-acetyltransferase [Anaerolineae bacterium]|nr:GNAT family N-acetyltransferase [Anaerolineae bacterium]
MIERINRVDDELIEAFKYLSPQLSASMPVPGREQLEEIVNSPATHLFVARDESQNKRIIGTLTLVIFRTPAGVSAHIEDVVVDQSQRGRGWGEALTRAAISLAMERGAKKVDLTSAPRREAANRLYQRLGFVRWETNFYRMILSKKD